MALELGNEQRLEQFGGASQKKPTLRAQGNSGKGSEEDSCREKPKLSQQRFK